MIEKYIEDIYQRIKQVNEKIDLDSIPHSDGFAREILGSFGIEKHDAAQIIRILKEAHKIFTIEITKEEKDIKRVEGYVACDLKVIRSLKNFFQAVLMEEYQKQNRARLLVHQIAKDIYNRPHVYKNTMIGQIANKAIMLEEYEKMMEQHFEEFTEEWTSRKLRDLLLRAEVKLAEKSIQDDVRRHKDRGDSGEGAVRAVDTELYREFSSATAKFSLSKVIEIYGIEFFFRVNLRKYNFDLLKQVLDSGQIDSRSDLTNLKNMLQRVKTNMERDPGLMEHAEQIHQLERSLSRSLLRSR